MHGKKVLGIALIAVLSLAGCSASESASEGDLTFTLAFGADPGNLDPAMTTMAAAREAALLAYDTLVLQKLSGEYVDGLAETWEVSDSGIAFELKSGITCSDGSAFTAQDAADNINFITDPENLSPLLGTYIQPGVTAEADGELGLIVTSVDPDPFMLNGLTHVMMVCRAGLDDRTLLAQDTIGTGLWDLTKSVPNDHYEFTRRADYSWGPRLTLDGTVPDRVIVRIVTNQTTAANLLLAGEVNMARIGGAEAARVANLDKLDEKYPSGQTYFNQGEGRLAADLNLRRALAMASNAEVLGKVATGGEFVPSESLVVLNPGACAFVDTVTANSPGYDPAAAAQLLESSGWTLGANGLRSKDGRDLVLDFAYFETEGEQVAAAAELLAMQWKEVGIELNTHKRTETQMTETLWGTGDWDVAWVPVGVATPSQMRSLLSGPAAPEGANFGNIQNAEYNRFADEASQLATAEESCAVWVDAEQSLMTNVDVLPMFDTVTSVYFNGGRAEVVAAELQGWSLRLD